MRTSKKILAIFIAVIMLLSILPTNIFAVTITAPSSRKIEDFNFGIPGYSANDHFGTILMRDDVTYVYCVEFTKPLNSSVQRSETAQSAYNKLSAKQKTLVSLILFFGFRNRSSWEAQWAQHSSIAGASDRDAYMATQALIWAATDKNNDGAWVTNDDSFIANTLSIVPSKGGTESEYAVICNLYSYIRGAVLAAYNNGKCAPDFDEQTYTMKYDIASNKFVYNGNISGMSHFTLGTSAGSVQIEQNGDNVKATSTQVVSPSKSVTATRDWVVANNIPFFTVSGGKATIGSHMNLSVYVKGRTKINPVYLVANDGTSQDVVEPKATTDPLTAVIKFTSEPIGRLTIKKNAYGSDGNINNSDNNVYTFRISGTTSGGTPVNISGINITGNGEYSCVLPVGNYTVTETNCPSYMVSTSNPTNGSVTITNGGESTVTFNNKYAVGNLRIRKISEDGSSLGWSFKIKSIQLNDGSIYEETKATDSSGIVTFNNIPLGTYEISEINCPDNMRYIITGPSELTAQGETVEVRAENRYKRGALLINKVDSETGSVILSEDAVFAAYEWNKLTGEYLTTPKYFTFKNLDPAIYGTNAPASGYVLNDLVINSNNEGKYRVVEIAPPTGYLPSAETYDVQLTEEGQVINVNDGSIANTPQKGQIVVHKTDSENGSNIENAVYKVTAKEDVVYNGVTLYSAGSTVANITTESNGCAYLEVYLGSYNIEEVSAPNGYLIDKTVYSATLTYNAQVLFVESNHDVTDTAQKGKITLNKYDSETGALVLASAKYNVFADENIYVNGILTVNKDALVGTITTVNGTGSLENLYLGTYRLEESEAPNGYLKTSSVVTATLTYAGQDVAIATATASAYDAPQYGVIKIRKYDANSALITGASASFKIYAAENIFANGVKKYNKDELVDTVNTVDGVAVSGQLPLGEYYVKEYTAPDGYVINTQKFSASLQYNGEVAIVEKTVSVTNNNQKGTITILKYDSENNSVVANSEFKITAAEDIYENGNKIYSKNQTVETLVTNEQGKATSSPLPLGSYTVKETKAPKPYVRDKGVYDVVLSYQGQSVSVFDNPVQVTNTPQKGVIELMKVDSETNKPLANAVFEIYAAEAIEVNGYGYYLANDLVDTITTGSDGKATSSNLYVGKYRVVEKTAPTGYVLSPDVHNIEIEYIGQEVDIHTVSFTAENAPQLANIEIVKTDRETNLPLDNAVYEIYAAEDVIINGDVKYANGALVDTVTTSAEGKAQSKLLYLGKYTVKEKTAPHGYVLNADEIPVSLEYKGQNVSSFIETVNTDDIAQKGKLSVYKYGEVFSTVDYTDGYYQPVYEVKPLKNAVYDIFADEDIYTGDGTLRYAKDTLVDTVTTGENGVGESDELYLGKYRVVENTAPDKMVNNPSPNFVELVYGDQNVEVVTNETSFTNDRQTATFVLDKILEKDDVFDDIGGNGEIENIFFGLYAAEDLVADDGTVIPADGIIEIARCDEEGRVMFDTDVPVGKYYTQEIATDEHYLISDAKYELNYQYAGQYILTVEIKANDGDPIVNSLIRGNILGKKTNDDGNPVQGALMGLFRVTEIDCSELTALKLAETDENGEFLFEDVPYGDYIVKELKAPTGYVLNEAATPVSVKENDVTVEIEVLNSIIKGTVTTTKVDAEYPDNKLIGAKFEIYADSNANEEFDADIDTLIGVMTDNGDGTYTMSDLRYNGYFMKEVEAPYGFLVDENYYYFEIRNEGEVITVENESGKGCFVDKPGTGELEITKVDIADGKLIPNAGFRIRDLDGNIIVEGRTDENGIAKFKLRIGKYTYEEFDAPAGYILDNAKYPFEIKEHGEIVKALATNEKFVPIPKTGDSLRFAVPCLFALAAASLVGITATTYAKKKRKKSEIDE